MESYKMDFATKTLTITKAFEEAAANPTSAEYELLTKFQKDIPNLAIVRKTHKTPSKYHTRDGQVYSCNQYKNLTYENMERFITSLEGHEEYLEVFNSIRNNLGVVQVNPYAIVRRWFVAQFPKYREDPIFYLKNKVDVITEIAPFILATIAMAAKKATKKEE